MLPLTLSFRRECSSVSLSFFPDLSFLVLPLLILRQPALFPLFVLLTEQFISSSGFLTLAHLLLGAPFVCLRVGAGAPVGLQTVRF